MKKILVSTFVVLILMVSVAFARGPMPPPPVTPENPYYDNGTVTTTATIDYRLGGRQVITLNGNVTVSWVLPPTGYYTEVILKVIQHAGVHYNITWVGTKWQQGLVPLITQDDGAIDFISCDLDNAGVYCTYGSRFQ